MPLYCYQCNGCNERFEIRHSMSYDEQTCIYCKSSDVFKIPSLASRQQKNIPTRVGKVVDQYLKDAKEEVEKEKNKLRSREL